MNVRQVELPVLVALAIIKLRIVAAHNAAAQSINLAFKGLLGSVFKKFNLP